MSLRLSGHMLMVLNTNKMRSKYPQLVGFVAFVGGGIEIASCHSLPLEALVTILTTIGPMS